LICRYLGCISPESAVPNPHTPIFPKYGDEVIRDKTLGIAVVDPYYMRESQLSTLEGKKVASEYLSVVMRKSIGKDLLMAYFPE
jgi:hypothetical protein